MKFQLKPIRISYFFADFLEFACTENCEIVTEIALPYQREMKNSLRDSLFLFVMNKRLCGLELNKLYLLCFKFDVKNKNELSNAGKYKLS